MAVFTAISALVTAIGTAIGLAGTALTVFTAVGSVLLSVGISALVAKRMQPDLGAGLGAGQGGGRIQLPPATDNKIPVVYGSGYVSGPVIDAKLSTDQQYMWYVVALAEVSDDQGGGAGTYTFDTSKFYYDGKNVQFGTNGAVTALITNTTPAQSDTRCNGFLYIYLFNNGSSSGVNTGGQTAAQILSTTNGVPAGQAWGAGQTMTNCAFAIVKVIYSTDAGTTGAGQLTAHITNSITKPGDAILDYMLNDRYGCNLPLSAIDTTSLTALNTYSDDLIDYKPVGWNPGDPYSTQARYRINGPIDTGQNCLNNLQFLVDSCDSWLQYSELTGKWRVVMNKGYDQAPNAQTLNQLFLVNSSNLVGGIEVSPIDLNETYNQVEVGYPNTNIKDQTDYQIIDLYVEDPQLLSANEAVNRLNLTLPYVNNAVQAKYLAARRLYQSREDLVIAFKLDFSGIQIEAGDVIRVTHEVYGWTDKLFRVNNVAEEKDSSGNLFAAIQAFEYSNDIYDDIIEDYVPAFNTGLKDPNVISAPCDPVITNFTDANALVTGFDVTSCVPDEGLVLYMDFNYGNNSNVLEHRLYRTVQQSNGAPFVNSVTVSAANIANNTPYVIKFSGNTPWTSIGATSNAYGTSFTSNLANINIANTTGNAFSTYSPVTITVNDLPSANYYWSVTARNNTAGKRSGNSAVFPWNGANIQPYDPNTGNGGMNGNQYRPNSVGFTTIGNSVAALSPVGQAGFTVIDYGANTTTAPVDLSTLDMGDNLPWYLIGTDPGANYIYPFYQGTSTTANGYYANSTGAMTPALAGQIAIAQGDDNWYVFIADTYSSNILANVEYELKQDSFQFVSNVDAQIQVLDVNFATVGNVLYAYADTQQLNTVSLIANSPYFYYRQFSSTATANRGSGGVMVRNITANSNVTCISAFQTAYKGKL